VLLTAAQPIAVGADGLAAAEACIPEALSTAGASTDGLRETVAASLFTTGSTGLR
jgi:hypothetical protein